MDRQIVCVAVPSFEIALARRSNLALRTRPVAIAPLQSARARLRELSPEAERDGLAIGMPVASARRLCPALQVLPPDPARVHTAEASLLRVIAHYAPVWEPTLPGAFLLDVTGTGRLFGPACDVAAKVQQDILDTYQLDGVAGVGTNKLIAQTAASLMAPSELYEVRPGSEPEFMAPLSVRTLPGLHRPCMRTVLQRLDELNLETLGEVAESPLDALEAVMGDYAGQLSRWAHGMDPLPVLPPALQDGLDETIALDPDEIDDPVLIGRLLDTLQRLCRTLRSQRRVCSGLTLTITYSDQRMVTKHERVTSETCWEYDLSTLVVALFHKCTSRRIRLRSMVLGLTGLTAYAEQVSLFEDRSSGEQRKQDRAKRLAVALDTLQTRFGPDTVRYGRSR